MKSLREELTIPLRGSTHLVKAPLECRRTDSGLGVRSFGQLIELTAEVAYANPAHLLLFRGQSREYSDSRGRATIFPAMFRAKGRLTRDTILEGFTTLDAAERRIAEAWPVSLRGRRRVITDQPLRWALLQHYQICPTPMLDVTQSLRVACDPALI